MSSEDKSKDLITIWSYKDPIRRVNRSSDDSFQSNETINSSESLDLEDLDNNSLGSSESRDFDFEILDRKFESPHRTYTPKVTSPVKWCLVIVIAVIATLIYLIVQLIAWKKGCQSKPSLAIAAAFGIILGLTLRIILW